MPPTLVRLTASTSLGRDRTHAYIHRSTLPPFPERLSTNISFSSILHPCCTRPRSQLRVRHPQVLSSIHNTLSQSNSLAQRPQVQ
jgi:hypothetical protein